MRVKSNVFWKVPATFLEAPGITSKVRVPARCFGGSLQRVSGRVFGDASNGFQWIAEMCCWGTTHVSVVPTACFRVICNRVLRLTSTERHISLQVWLRSILGVACGKRISRCLGSVGRELDTRRRHKDFGQGLRSRS